MQPAINTARKKQIIIFAVIVLLALLGFYIYRSLQFRIVSSDPGMGDVAAISPYLKLTFNRELSTTGSAVSSPQNIVRTHSISGKTLEIDFTNGSMEAGKTYTIIIKSLNSSAGSKITNKSVSFKTKDVKVNELSKDQQKALINNQSRFSPAQSDPILNHLPYSNLDFRIDPVISGDKNNKEQLVLKIQLLLVPGLTGAQGDKVAAQHKAEALNYIRSFKLDPTNYTIQYETIHESLSGV